MVNDGTRDVRKRPDYTDLGKLTPQDTDLEQVILGTLLSERHSIDLVRDILLPGTFYKEAHQIIYDAIYKLDQNNASIDIVIVTGEIKRAGKLDLVGGPYYITQLTDRFVGSANLEYNCRILLELHLKRQLIVVSSNVLKNAYDVTNDVILDFNSARKELEQIEDRIYVRGTEINGNMKPMENPTVLCFNGRRILGVGNIGAIVAPPGTGKSQICEAGVSRGINKLCDGIGFDPILLDGKKMLYVDTERSIDDATKGFDKISRRVMLSENPGLIDEYKKFKALTYDSLVEVGSKDERKMRLQNRIKRGNYGLVWLDGITDFIRDSNDIGESGDFIEWLRSLANIYKMGIMVTIHDNPANATEKPRGHIGSELYRKCESMLLLKRVPEDKNLRMVTTDFKFGKVRNDQDTGNDVYYSWDSHWGMFRTVDFTPTAKTKESIGFLDRMNILFMKTQRYAYSDLISAYKGKFGVAESTAKKHITECLNMELIVKDPATTLYRLPTEQPPF
jgi:hypothetical protein